MCWHPSRWTNTRVAVQLIPCTSMFIFSSNTQVLQCNYFTSIASPQVISPRLRVSGCVVPFFSFVVVLAPEPFEVLRQVATPSWVSTCQGIFSKVAALTRVPTCYGDFTLNVGRNTLGFRPFGSRRNSSARVHCPSVLNEGYGW